MMAVGEEGRRGVAVGAGVAAGRRLWTPAPEWRPALGEGRAN
jgi:hypothetical protein